jgi:peptidoglycan/LPS O-acetylase OafA/YrhL
MSKNVHMPDTRTERVFGLDVLCAIAVLSVLVGHSLTHGTSPGRLLAYIAPKQSPASRFSMY